VGNDVAQVSCRFFGFARFSNGKPTKARRCDS